MKSYPKVRAKIIEKYGSQKEFAAAIGKTEQTITAKLNGNSEFTQSDITMWATLLGIEDIDGYFFKD